MHPGATPRKGYRNREDRSSPKRFLPFFLPGSIGPASKSLEDGAKASRNGRRNHRPKVRRSLSQSRRFEETWHYGRRFRIRRPLASEIVIESWRQAEVLLSSKGWSEPSFIGSSEVVWRSFKPRGLKEKLLATVGHSHGVRAWRGAHVLETREIPGPRCLALVGPGRILGRWGRHDILIEKPEVKPLDEVLRRAITAGRKATYALAQKTGSLLALLHESGITLAGGSRIPDFVAAVKGDRILLQVRLEACSRICLPQILRPTKARADVIRLAREAGSLVGDGVSRRLDEAYRQGRQLRKSPVQWPIEPPPARILIVKTGAVGDVVSTLPLANRLHKTFPGVKIGWVVGSSARAILEGHPAVEHLIDFPRHSFGRDWLKFVRELRRFQPHIAIDAGRTLKTGLISVLSGACWRLGFDRQRSKEGSWLLSNRLLSPPLGWGLVLEHYLEFADFLGCPEEPPHWDLQLQPEAERRAEELLSGASAPIVGVVVGATKSTNRWPPHRLAALCGYVLARGGTPVLIGGPEERLRGELISDLVGEGIFNLVGKTDLKSLAAVLARCRVVVSHDTGPLHLAVAVGTPTVSLFGAADPLRTGPYGQLDTVVRTGLPCSPCRERRCRFRTRACMGLLEPDSVLMTLDQVLRGENPAPAPVPMPQLRVSVQRRGPWRIAWDPDRLPGELTERLDRLSELLGDNKAQRYNIYLTSETIRWEDPAVGPLFVKQYKPRSLLDLMGNSFRSSRASKSWKAGRRLVEMGIPTGRPVAVAERRSRFLLREYYVVTEKVQHKGNVIEWFRNRGSSHQDRVRFTRAFGRYLRYLHRRGIYPRELNGTDILVCEQKGIWSFALINPERVSFDRQVGEGDAVRNIVCLNISFGELPSRTDRLRFLYAFLGEDSSDRPKVRRMVKAVLRRTAQRLP